MSAGNVRCRGVAAYWFCLSLCILVGDGLAAERASRDSGGPASQPCAREGTITTRGQYPAEPSLVLWQPGSMAWPNLRDGLGGEPATSTSTFGTVELTNAWLTARFVPQIGFRLYDLTWNDDSLKCQPFRRVDEIEYHNLWRWEGPGYFLFFGSMKWGFPYYGHTTSDHMPWTVTHGMDESGNAWAEGTYTCLDTGIVGTVRAVLPKDAARVDFTFACRNPRNERQGFDYWIDSHVPANRHTEFAMPASEGITHQRSWNLMRQMFFPWPRLGKADLRFLRDWDGSQGVFPADLQAGYSGFYNHARQAGVMRVFPPKVAGGVKYWMPGIDWGSDPVGEMFGGSEITQDERRYLGPGETLSWQETWYPVRNLQGIDGGNQDVALRLAADKDGAALHLTSTRQIDAAIVTVQQQSDEAASRQLYRTNVSLWPGRTTTIDLPAIDTSRPGGLQVTIETGRETFVWREKLDLLKPSYTDENLDKARQTYSNQLRKEAASPTDADREAPPPPERFTYQHAGTIGADSKQLLSMPNACCALPDGTIAVADINTIRIHGPDTSFQRVLEVKDLRWPLGLCADAETLYIADTSNRRIVCVDLASQKVTRTIGLASEPAGIALWRGGLAIALPRASEVVQIDLGKDDAKPRTLADSKDLRHPFGLGADGERLLVADPSSHRVVAISRDGKTSVLADRKQGLAMPSRVAVLAGKVYVSDSERCQLLCLDRAGGAASVHVNGRLFGPIPMGLAGDLAAVGDELVVATAYPAGLTAVCADGQVSGKYDLRKDFWPGKRPTFHSFCRRPNGDWLAADTNFHVLWYDRDGVLKNIYGAWGRGDGQFWEPGPMACDSRGYLYVNDFFNFRVLRYDPQMEQMSNLGMDCIQTDGVPAPERWYVRGLAIDGTDRVAVAVCGGQGIYLYSPGPRNDLLLILRPYDRFYPMGVAFDKKGNLFAIDDAAGKVLVYPAGDLAKHLQSTAAGQVLCGADLAPTIWSFQPNTCATCVVADEQGGCYVALTGRIEKTDGGSIGTIAHFDATGRIDRTIVSRWSGLTVCMVLDGDRLIVANSNMRMEPGINAIPLIQPAATAPGSQAAASAPATQPIGKTLFKTAWSEQPDQPGAFRALTGIHRVGGAEGGYQVLDEHRGKMVTIDPASLKILGEKPTDVFARWSNTNADGSIVLHTWKKSTSLLCELDGTTRTIEFKGVKNPALTARDFDGCWWVADENGHTLMFFDAKGPEGAEPLWTVHCGEKADPIAETWSVAPLPDGNAWIIERERHRLSLLSRQDGRVLKSTPKGVVRSPESVRALPDGSLLVTDRRWGILQVSADGLQSWRVIKDLPGAEGYNLFVDPYTGRLLGGESPTIGYADPIRDSGT